MKINIYYGGRGIIDDPTLFAINRIQSVLEELNVSVARFNLYELKNSITTLPASINDCDAVILAATVEWLGVGGYLMQFLDSCWLYGNKDIISRTYMCPIVMSTISGEREAKMLLQTAWETLGGISMDGLCGYVSDMMQFEMNKDYVGIIEKTAENIYRTVNQKTPSLPSSKQTLIKIANNPLPIPLSPQETEQLSKYASDEGFVQKQKEDISELASHFRNMLDAKSVDENLVYISDFMNHYNHASAVDGVFKLVIKDRKKPLIIDISNKELNCYYGDTDSYNVLCKITPEILNKIITGRETFQRAFMSGEMQVKGDFSLMRKLDEAFVFYESDK